MDRLLANVATRDHIYPRWLVRRFRRRPSDYRRQLNSAPACLACNNAKGGMQHPLEWLERLSADAQHRLGVRLQHLNAGFVTESKLDQFVIVTPIPDSGWLIYSPLHCGKCLPELP